MSVPLPNPLPPGTSHPLPACDFETAARTQDLVASAAPSDLALRRAAAAAGERVHHLDLPPEVSLAEAASIANCDKKTIIRYMRDGLLEWRNIAPPSSSRPTYRVKLASVIALRTNYQQGNPQHGRHVDDPPSKAPPPRGRAPGRHQFKHIWVGRG